MKFDVVVGNPPFQDGDTGSKKKLWEDFIFLGSDCLKTDGYMSFICPPSWVTSGISKRKEDLFNIIVKNNLTDLNLDCGKYFKSVGVGFCWFTFSKTTQLKPLTRLVQNGNTINIALSTLPLIPLQINHLSLSIVDKIYNSGLPKLSFSVKGQAQIGNSNDQPSYREMAYHGGCNLVPVLKAGSNSTLKKVMISRSGYPKVVYDDGNYSTTASVFWVISDDVEGPNLVSFLSTKIIHNMLHGLFSNASFTVSLAVKLLPKVDLTHAWTDIDVANYFNLTTDELVYINNLKRGK